MKPHQKTILLIALVCAVPIVAAYWLFFFGDHDKTINYGELLEPQQVVESEMVTPEGNRFALKDLRGKWVLLLVESGECNQDCLQRLFLMRQVRMAQGENMNRLERVWLVSDSRIPNAELQTQYAGMHVARLDDGLRNQLSRYGEGRIVVIDPMGNIMMRYLPMPDGTKMIKDFQRLLKYSGAG